LCSSKVLADNRAMRGRGVVLLCAAWLGCSDPPQHPAPPPATNGGVAPRARAGDAAVAAPAASDASVAVADAGAVVADAGGPAPGGGTGIGGPGIGLRACTIPPRPRAECAAASLAPAALTREVERLLRRTASQGSFISSESADVVRARSIRVGLAERTESRLRVLADFLADTAGSYRDTRGQLDPRQVETGASPYCIELSFVRQEDAFVLEPPACVQGLGRVSFRPTPVKLPPP